MIITPSLTEAVRACNLGNGSKRIFAEEVGPKGERNFIVTTAKTFADFYNFISPGQHFYEVLSGNHPKKAFWDIDLWDNATQGTERDILKENLILRIIMELVISFSEIGYTLCRDDFIILDSSSSQKISFHLILHKGPRFHNCKEIGEITRQTFYSGNEPKKEFSVSVDGIPKGIVDLRVYGSNQNFRIWKSSKFGKTATLKISNHDRLLRNIDNEEEKLLATLINGNKEDPCIDQPGTNPIPRSKDKFRIKNQNPNTNTTVEKIVHVAIQELSGTTISNCKILNPHTILINTKKKMICENVKRTHRRNRTYFLMNTDSGRIFKKCYKCTEHILSSFKIIQ